MKTGTLVAFFLLILIGLSFIAGLLNGLRRNETEFHPVVDNFNSGEGIVSSTGDPGPTNFASVDAVGGSRTLEIIGFPGDGGLRREHDLHRDAFAEIVRRRQTWRLPSRRRLPRAKRKSKRDRS